jgi:hypothetical protein
MSFWISVMASLVLVGSMMEMALGRFYPGIRTLAQLKALETNGYWIFSIGVLVCTFALNRLIGPARKTQEGGVKPAFPRADQSPARHRGAAFWTLFGVVVPIFLICHTYPPPNLSANIDPIDHQEEGVRAAAANQYLHGKQPYRDIYLLYGIGNEIIEPLGAFHLFGMRLSSLRRWACVQAVSSSLALYVLGLILLQTPGALMALAFLMAYRNPFWISFRAAWALGAMGCIMNAQRRRARPAWILAGVSCVIAFLYSKESGVIPALSAGFLIVYQWLREGVEDSRPALASFAMGGAFIGFPFLAWLAATGGLRFLLHDVLHPAVGYLSIWSKAAPALVTPLRRLLSDPLFFYRPEGVGLRWWFPALFYVVTLAWSLQRFPTWRMQRVRILALFCWLYFLVALGRSDFDHWLKGTSGYWLLLVAVSEQVWLVRPQAPWSGGKIVQTMFGVFLISVLVPVAFEGALLTSTSDHLKMWKTALRNPNVPVNAPLVRLGPRRLAPGELDRWMGIADRVHRWAAPGDYVYLYCDYPTLYFLCDVINPTRYADLNYIVSPTMEAEVIASLERNPPRVIVGEWSGGQLVIPAYAQNIARYIQTHFHPEDVFGGFVFYRPNHAIQ